MLQRKKLVAQILAAAIIFVLVGSISSVALAGNSHHSDNKGKVRICHRTGSFSNFYVSENVNESSVDGHGYGDIIPPYGNFRGLNWASEGQAIWNNNCKIPGRPTPKPTCTTTLTPTPTPSSTPSQTPTPTPSPTITPQVLGTSTPGAGSVSGSTTSQNQLPTTGGSDNSLTYLIMIGVLALVYYLKKAGWAKLA